MARFHQTDPQHLIERAKQRSSRAAGDQYAPGQHTLAGAGVSYGSDDDLSAAADLWVRRFANRHSCQAPGLLREAVERGWHNKAARIRENPAAFCSHPRHGEDAAFATEGLEWLGLRPTPRPQVQSKAITARPRLRPRYGRCPSCRRSRYLRTDGTLGAHNAPDDNACPGSGQKPEEAAR